MSTALQIAGKVEKRLRRRLAPAEADHDAMLLDAVNWAIAELQTRWTWSAMETVLELVTVESHAYVNLPAGYVRMRPEMQSQGVVYRLVGADWVVIPQMRQGQLVTIDMLRALYPDATETGQPAWCCVWGRAVYLGPTPDALYDLRIPAIVRLDALEAGESNWFAENLEEAVCEMATARGFRDLFEEQQADTREARGLALAERAWGQDAYERSSRVGPRSGRIRGGG